MERGRRVTSLPPAGFVRLPSHPVSPLFAVIRRVLAGFTLLVLATLVVYLDRHGYRDSAHPGRPLSLLGAIYYGTVTLSTVGYGDIVPVTTAARLANILLITPMRVLFLIILVSTTLEVLAERTRRNWRIARWRSKVAGQAVVVGYGTKGRSAIATLREAGWPDAAIVVVDCDAEAAEEANAAGLVAVTGDAARRAVLARAEADRAAQIVIAVHRDDSAALITLTARQISPGAVIIASVREHENEPLLRQSGADHVVVSSDAAGRLLGMSAIRPSAGTAMVDLLDRGGDLDLTERHVAPAEVGHSAREVTDTVIAVMRGGRLLPADRGEAGRLEAGDRLILIESDGRPGQRRPAQR